MRNINIKVCNKLACRFLPVSLSHLSAGQQLEVLKRTTYLMKIIGG